MPKKDDYYIAMLMYGRDALRKSETAHPKEYLEHMTEIYPDIDRQCLLRSFWDAFESRADFSGGYDLWLKNNTPFDLSLNSYFHLLEHEELKEARTSSRKALRRSTVAIVISAGLALASIGIQLGYPTDVVVADRQIERVLRTVDEWRLDQLSVLTDINYHVSAMASHAASQ